MKTQNRNNQTALSARKRGQPSHDWFLVLHLIGWESGTIFLDQSQSEVKQNQNQCNLGLLSALNWKWLYLCRRSGGKRWKIHKIHPDKVQFEQFIQIVQCCFYLSVLKRRRDDLKVKDLWDSSHISSCNISIQRSLVKTEFIPLADWFT